MGIKVGSFTRYHGTGTLVTLNIPVGTRRVGARVAILKWMYEGRFVGNGSGEYRGVCVLWWVPWGG